MLISKINKEIMQTKPRPHLLSAGAVKILENHGGRGVKLAGGSDCE
jgi:hypothetical protein